MCLLEPIDCTQYYLVEWRGKWNLKKIGFRPWKAAYVSHEGEIRPYVVRVQRWFWFFHSFMTWLQRNWKHTIKTYQNINCSFLKASSSKKLKFSFVHPFNDNEGDTWLGSFLCWSVTPHHNRLWETFQCCGPQCDDKGRFQWFHFQRQRPLLPSF